MSGDYVNLTSAETAYSSQKIPNQLSKTPAEAATLLKPRAFQDIFRSGAALDKLALSVR